MNVIRMADLSRQLDEIQPQFGEVLNNHLRTGSFIGGSSVAEFEQAFSSFTGAEYVVGVGNGTDALEIILQSLEMPAKSVVLVPANSFVATAESVLNTGHTLRLVEVGEDFGFDQADLERKLTADVRAVIAVHLYGIPQDLSWLAERSAEAGFFLIEDCAQAHGATLRSTHVGRFGAAGAFSFYPGKNLGALGDAGGIITDNPLIAERARRIANHGRLSKFDHDILGRNSRLDSIQAATLTLKLKKLNEWNLRRVSNAKVYREELAGIAGLRLPPESQGFQVYHHFVIRCGRRDELRAFLLSRGIETGIHYPQSIDEFPPYAAFSDRPLIVSREFSQTMTSLPVGEHLTHDEVRRVSSSVRDFLSNT